jgi:EAL domain-containing protein (putative c-di-GMP-specific phosphodiesterase class I)
MVYQPIVDLAGGHTVGVEALARFDCVPQRSPAAWFAEAAEVGLAVELDLAAVEASLGALDWLPEDVFLSVNVSPATAISGRLHECLHGVPSNRIVLELTEHTRIDDYDALRTALDELRHQGARVAVDDAGAGYAGLQQILRLRPDIVKLDLEFTRTIDADPVRRALATSLVTFGRDTGELIIAEGIETPEEFETLERLGVCWGQGFYLAPPGPLADHGPVHR